MIELPVLDATVLDKPLSFDANVVRMSIYRVWYYGIDDGIITPGYFVHKEQAEKCVAQCEEDGYRTYSSKEEHWVVFPKNSEILHILGPTVDNNRGPEEIRAKALAKLTDEERKVLGV